MTMEVIETGRHFDPTPEQQHAKAVDDWRALLAAYETERQGVAEAIGQLQIVVDGFVTRSYRTPHDEAVAGIERINLTEKLAHKRARLDHIDSVIAAHRKARP